MDLQSFASAIDQICEEKGISKKKVIETIEMALSAAYKKDYGHKGQNIRVEFNSKTGKTKIFLAKLVVDQSMLKLEDEKTEREVKSETTEEAEAQKKIRFNPEKHILIEEAKKLKKEFSAKKLKGLKPGDELEFPLKVHEDYGRIAAQTAKQVIIQRIREAERESIYDEYKEKENQLISGIVQRVEGANVFVDIGKATGILFPEEQIPRENYRIGQRLRAYIIEVKKDAREPGIILSRTHPKMVSQLFALEVPEISAGTVQIKSISREPGSRTKIAVASTDERVDPIGSMIGQKGTRVQAVIGELAGEKIDIIEWSDDPAKFISQALSPAKVIEVKTDDKKKQAEVVVPQDQLSLAIGAKGQNVRLAAKLTGWKIDIVPFKEELDKQNSDKKDRQEKKEKKEKTKTKKTKTIKKAKKEKTEIKEKKVKKEKDASEPEKKKIKKQEKEAAEQKEG